MQDLPSGTITFLFTDIEGSTQLWEQHPEAMRLALARHDVLLRSAMEQNNGYVFKTVGDAFCAAFFTAQEALNAALTAQRALLAETWPGELVLRVRMALHTGTAEFRDNDYFGQTLNRVARLLAIGHGGQTLISQATHQCLPADMALSDQGIHRLKDLQQPEHVWQPVAPDLPFDLPPLRSLNPQRHNLPIQATSFIGREREIEEVKALLASTRLLTLTGMGGCGKTRLALQVAADQIEAYPDGVWLVELAALTEPALVPQGVASVLGLREEPGRLLSETLTEYLKPKTLLLLLDNCEHLVDACAQLADTLLRACPHVTILATSRERLNVGGEQPWRIPSLLAPDPQALPVDEKDLSALVMEYDAARLFVERAVMQRAEFRLSSGNAVSVAAVCHHLDGIPLALELAAARVRVMTVEEITKRLDDRLRLLTGGIRTALPRQQTLRALLDWSYDLLNAQERRLLQCLSVFAGGWSLAAAETIGSGEDIEDWEVLDVLTSLVDKSLVIVEEREGETRYRLLETVWVYSREQLEASREEASVRDRHLAWFLRLAEEAEPQLTGPAQGDWLDRLETEHDNLRAAIEWSLRTASGSEDAETDLRLCGALWQFWDTRGYLAEGRRWYSAVLTRETEAYGRTSARAKALCGAGNLAESQGDAIVARTLFEEALAICREIGDRRGIAAALGNLGNVAHSQSDYRLERSLNEEALAIYREVSNRKGIANTLNSLGNVAYAQSDMMLAKARYEEALFIHRELGDRLSAATTLSNLGNVARSQGDYAAARTLYEEALMIQREFSDQHSIAYTLNSLGIVADNRGDYGSARALYTEALAIRRELGEQRGTAITLHNLGGIASSQGDYVTAQALWKEALAIRREVGDRRGLALTLENLGRLAAVQSDYDAARKLLEEALAIQREIASRWGIANVLDNLSGVAHAQGDFITARTLSEETLAIRREIGDRRGIAYSFEAFAALVTAEVQKESSLVAPMSALDENRPAQSTIRAVRLWSAAQALREIIGSPLQLDQQEEHDREVAAVRAILGEAEFTAAWEAGRVLTMEQAIEYALSRAE